VANCVKKEPSPSRFCTVANSTWAFAACRVIILFGRFTFYADSVASCCCLYLNSLWVQDVLVPVMGRLCSCSSLRTSANVMAWTAWYNSFSLSFIVDIFS
jgi:hypothetical protein